MMDGVALMERSCRDSVKMWWMELKRWRIVVSENLIDCCLAGVVR